MIKYILFFSMLMTNSFFSAASNFEDRINDEDFRDLSIIMPSYDKYSELWRPNFTLLFRNWPAIEQELAHVPIYLVSNSEKYEHPRITNILVGDIDRTWSDNFIKGLEHVKTKYTLIILDDYIITRPVEGVRLGEILQLMRSNGVAYSEIALDGVLNDGPLVKNAQSIIQRSHHGPYRTSLQTCIWETEILKWLLKPGENIWAFEQEGSIRSQGVMKPFYLVIDQPVFTYLNAVTHGHYLKNVVDYINQQGIAFAPKKMPIFDNVTPKNQRLESIIKWLHDFLKG